jgi:hypothetical protein
MTIPATEELVPVPVPPAAVRFRTTFPVIVAAGALSRKPWTMLPVAVDVLWIEFATLPPTVLFWQMNPTDEPVNTRMP